MDNATKISLLKEEYVLLQKFYEDFDQRVITIKGWSATIAIAAIGLGFYQSRYLWLFAAGASLAFWLLESFWKGFQYMHAVRISVIEDAFRKDNLDQLTPLQIYSSWFDAQNKYGLQIWRNFKLAIVSLPHIITFVIGVVLFILQSAGVPLALK